MDGLVNITITDFGGGFSDRLKRIMGGDFDAGLRDTGILKVLADTNLDLIYKALHNADPMGRLSLQERDTALGNMDFCIDGKSVFEICAGKYGSKFEQLSGQQKDAVMGAEVYSAMLSRDKVIDVTRYNPENPSQSQIFTVRPQVASPTRNPFAMFWNLLREAFGAAGSNRAALRSYDTLIETTRVQREADIRRDLAEQKQKEKEVQQQAPVRQQEDPRREINMEEINKPKVPDKPPPPAPVQEEKQQEEQQKQQEEEKKQEEEIIEEDPEIEEIEDLEGELTLEEAYRQIREREEKEKEQEEKEKEQEEKEKEQEEEKKQEEEIIEDEPEKKKNPGERDWNKEADDILVQYERDDVQEMLIKTEAQVKEENKIDTDAFFAGHDMAELKKNAEEMGLDPATINTDFARLYMFSKGETTGEILSQDEHDLDRKREIGNEIADMLKRKDREQVTKMFSDAAARLSDGSGYPEVDITNDRDIVRQMRDNDCLGRMISNLHDNVFNPENGTYGRDVENAIGSDAYEKFGRYSENFETVNKMVCGSRKNVIRTDDYSRAYRQTEQYQNLNDKEKFIWGNRNIVVRNNPTKLAVDTYHAERAHFFKEKYGKSLIDMPADHYEKTKDSIGKYTQAYKLFNSEQLDYVRGQITRGERPGGPRPEIKKEEPVRKDVSHQFTEQKQPPVKQSPEKKEPQKVVNPPQRGGKG